MIIESQSATEGETGKDIPTDASPDPKSDWAWVSSAFPAAVVAADCFGGVKVTIGNDTRLWSGSSWPGMTEAGTRLSSHDAPLDGVDQHVIRSVYKPTGGGESRWEVSRMLTEGIYACAEGSSATFELALSAAVDEALRPQTRLGVDWYQEWTGFVATVDAEKWTVEKRQGQGWKWERRVVGASIVEAHAVLCSVMSGYCSFSPGVLCGLEPTREEAEQACSSAPQRLRAAAAKILGVIEPDNSTGDDFQRGWNQGRLELKAVIGAM